MGKKELTGTVACVGGMLGRRQQLLKAREDKNRTLGEENKLLWGSRWGVQGQGMYLCCRRAKNGCC